MDIALGRLPDEFVEDRINRARMLLGHSPLREGGKGYS